VIGTSAQIPELVLKYAIDIVIIAVEDMSSEAVWQIISICQETPAQIKVLPDIPDLMNQQYEHPLALRELRVEDLLNRRPMKVDTVLCQALLKDKVVLVTGAAGSIGSELCRQLCRYDLAQLLMLDNNETGLFDLNLDLNRKSKIPIMLLLADITDRSKLEAIFQNYRPHLVFHAAAYKHVPLLESNPDQSLAVNIKGTMNVSEVAHKYLTERFVFISSDKAVKPSSVMGASKYVGELWLQALNRQSRTKFSVVRFGNVIGSRGSVLPIFANQIEQGGPVTVTHKEMKRFFMSIPEAVSLVLQAAAFGRGGELFMLDMGEEVRIQDLAERMIRLKGLRVHKDIPIQYVGIRPGEKLREALYYDDEQRIETMHPRVFQLQTRGALPTLAQFQMAVDRLESYVGQPDSTNFLGRAILKLAIQPSEQIRALNGQTAVPQQRTGEIPEKAFV
jgi:FlaA1/EpsC-like NDP-sugar epimerase